MPLLDRREFLQTSTLAAAAALASRAHVAEAQNDSPSEQISAAVIGLGRGLAHAQALLAAPNARIAYLCDVEKNRLTQGMKNVEAKITEKNLKQSLPNPISDLRRALDDPKLDAVFIATCNHWHAPATILACAAGKHVYVEKPGSHNAREGQLMVAAARKHRRIVQMGNQRRTFPAIQEAVEKLRSGAIGKVLYARCWYNASRPSIGKGKPAPVPENLDYSMWQGPAPERPYKDNLIPYNWHWHWHWGGGELANNGIHALDVARWGLGVDYPVAVSFLGGRYTYDDDQETPDTGVAVYHFANGVGCSWEVSSCHPRKEEKQPMCIFYGTEGTLHITDPGYVVYDLKGNKTGLENKGDSAFQPHVNNFLECIRTGKAPNSEIEEGQKSTLLCHLGNISYRSGRMIHFDPAKKEIVGDKDAAALWGREYRLGWEPQV